MSYKVNAETDDGRSFVRMHRVIAYPTMLYFDPQGKIVHKTVDSGTADDILGFAADALKPETQLFTLKKKFREGERETSFLKKYVKALADGYENPSEPIDIYFQLIGKENWATQESWDFIYKYVKSSSSEIFEYVFENQDKFTPFVAQENHITRKLPHSS